jgi:hypothetical protein
LEQKMAATSPASLACFLNTATSRAKTVIIDQRDEVKKKKVGATLQMGSWREQPFRDLSKKDGVTEAREAALGFGAPLP